jgi:hypothetical protein
MLAAPAVPPGPPGEGRVIIARYPIPNYRKEKFSTIAAAIGAVRDVRFGGVAIPDRIPVRGKPGARAAARVPP